MARGHPSQYKTLTSTATLLSKIIGGFRKHELLTRSLRKMERTLDTVLRSISHPGMSAFASGMVSRSPSPSAQSQTAQTQALLNSPSPPSHVDPSPSEFLPGSGSPKLHALPDTLTPLGMLADASLANRRAQIANQTSSSTRMLANSLQPEDLKKVGVASDVYFKPGRPLFQQLFECESHILF